MENCPLPKCLSSKIGKGKVQTNWRCLNKEKNCSQNYKKKKMIKSVPTQMSFVRPKVFPRKYFQHDLNLMGSLTKRKVTNEWLYKYVQIWKLKNMRFFGQEFYTVREVFENSLLPQFLVSSLHKSWVVYVQYGLVQCLQCMKKHLTTMSFNAQ